MVDNKRGKFGKHIAVIAAILVVVFFAASFVMDKIELDKAFARKRVEQPKLMPTEGFASAYDSEPVEFQLQGATLRGYVYKADQPKGFIVFRHGIGFDHTVYLALICAMVERGWTVFAYDAIGSGISDGNNVKGMAQSALDVAAAVEFARSSNMIGDLPLALWGHSWGGYGVAAAMDIVPDVDACVSMSGFNSPTGVLMELTKSKLGPVGATQFPTMWLINKLTFGDDADRTALDGINKTDAPVLIIHGTDDKTVNFNGSAIIAQRDHITNESAQYVVMDEPDRNGHNTYFYTEQANKYLSEKTAELEELKERYPGGLPEKVATSFMEGYDYKRANVANPDLIEAIDTFLTESCAHPAAAR